MSITNAENSIVFSNVKKAYGKNIVIDNLNLSVKKGERLILLGPSGCGKTTTLRMIAGFEEITTGNLYMGGTVVNDISPGERNIAMVFQNYALFPHLSVWENITFGLKLQKLPEHEIVKRTQQAMEILHLQGYEDKKIHQLSGGQKQRVALCRAMVKQSPYFLLDEPLSNLDAKLRQKARTELVKIHEMFKPTMVYVTHDQIEAMTVAHRIAIMDKGRIQQIDTPEKIYYQPANTFVASFIGSPAMNIIKAEIINNKLLLGDNYVDIPQDRLREIGVRQKVLFGLRPEACQPSFNGGMIKGQVDFVENTGNMQTANFNIINGSNIYLQSSIQGIKLKDIQGFDFSWDNVCLFDEETGCNLNFGGK